MGSLLPYVYHFLLRMFRALNQAGKGGGEGLLTGSGPGLLKVWGAGGGRVSATQGCAQGSVIVLSDIMIEIQVKVPRTS